MSRTQTGEQKSSYSIMHNGSPTMAGACSSSDANHWQYWQRVYSGRRDSDSGAATTYHDHHHLSPFPWLRMQRRVGWWMLSDWNSAWMKNSILPLESRKTSTRIYPPHLNLNERGLEGAMLDLNHPAIQERRSCPLLGPCYHQTPGFIRVCGGRWRERHEDNLFTMTGRNPRRERQQGWGEGGSESLWSTRRLRFRSHCSRTRTSKKIPIRLSRHVWGAAVRRVLGVLLLRRQATRPILPKWRAITLFNWSSPLDGSVAGV